MLAPLTLKLGLDGNGGVSIGKRSFFSLLVPICRYRCRPQAHLERKTLFTSFLGPFAGSTFALPLEQFQWRKHKKGAEPPGPARTIQLQRRASYPVAKPGVNLVDGQKDSYHGSGKSHFPRTEYPTHAGVASRSQAPFDINRPGMRPNQSARKLYAERGLSREHSRHCTRPTYSYLGP